NRRRRPDSRHRRHLSCDRKARRRHLQARSRRRTLVPIAPSAPVKAPPASVRSEQIILFRVGGQLFAISSASVQEVRSVDSLAGSSNEISVPNLKKVRHTVQRGDKSLFVVNGAAHFGLPQTPGALVFVLRNTRTALLVDGIDKMSSMTRLQALPNAFCRQH